MYFHNGELRAQVPKWTSIIKKILYAPTEDVECSLQKRDTEINVHLVVRL